MKSYGLCITLLTLGLITQKAASQEQFTTQFAQCPEQLQTEFPLGKITVLGKVDGNCHFTLGTADKKLDCYLPLTVFMETFGDKQVAKGDLNLLSATLLKYCQIIGVPLNAEQQKYLDSLRALSPDEIADAVKVER